MKQRLLAVLVALIVPLGLFVSAPAQAADGNVYVVVNNRVCGTNSVRGILANVDGTSWQTSGYDHGDNIVYPRVNLYRTTTFTASVKCYKRYWWGWWHVGYGSVQGKFYATRTGQTFWVG